jgi:hypothetical protein
MMPSLFINHFVLLVLVVYSLLLQWCATLFFILKGLGWDTYRIWEALYLGVIPVMERYNRRDGWHRTMDGLPIVWVETFEQDLKPWLLESEYERIVTHSSKYNFEKLTIPYWKAFVESFLPNLKSHPVQ